MSVLAGKTVRAPYKIRGREGDEVETMHAFPLEQEKQHCFDFVNCDCDCCFPEIEDYSDQGGPIIITHNWIQ